MAIRNKINAMHTLLALLTEYLHGKTKLEYPEIQLHILQADPLRITDDFKFFLEISGLFGQAESQIVGDPLLYRLVLLKWNFEFKRVPNSQEYYLDINCRDFKLIKSNKRPKQATVTTKRITDNKEIQKLFEQKKNAVKNQAAKDEKSASASRKSMSPLRATALERSEGKRSSGKKSDPGTPQGRTLPRALKKVIKSRYYYDP